MKKIATAALALGAAAILSGPASASVIDNWTSIPLPPAPTLTKDVKLDAKTTVLLILDIVKQTCNKEKNPDCIASVPVVIDLAKRARAAGVKIVYSVTAVSTTKDILPGLEPQDGEPWVQAPADKFFKTKLDEILKQDGAKTVIVTGTRAYGAVLMTGVEAAYRGYKVVLPVDGVSSDVPYGNQYTAWNMLNAPSMPGNATETMAADISFK